MTNFFTRDNIIKVLVVLAIITLPIVLAIVFGKLDINLSFFQKTPVETPLVTQEKISKVFLYCPSISAFCTTGVPIVENGTTIGFGSNLQPGSPVKTAFNGKLTLFETTINKQQVQTAKLENPELKTIAFYYFIGDLLPKNEIPSDPSGYVKVGVTFGKITQNIAAYNTSLLFQLFVGDPSKVPQQALQPKSFIVPNQ